MSQTAKQALLEAGRIEAITRGRISLANHAWLKEQYDNGVRFSDWPKGEVQTNSDNEVRVIKKAEPIDNYAEVIYTYPEHMYRAIGTDNKEWGMREVCNNCRVSLVQNHCENPVILGDIKVRILAKA